MPRADWYFDFISPYAYLQFEILHRLPDDLEIAFKPVVFAGLLDHWGHKGPAEIPGKRIFIFRQCKWWADRNKIAFTMPPAHPFNPIKPLRLAIALDNKPAAIETIFRFVWAEGLDVARDWPALAERFAMSAAEADERVRAPEIKQALIANGEAAIGQGVFGVPTFVIDNEIIWGVDSTEMMVDYLDNPALFATEEMRKIITTKPAAQRKVPG